MRFQFFFLLLCLQLSLVSTLSAADTQQSITINGDTPILIMKDDYNKVPLQKVIRDIERDWYKVFGYPAVVFVNSIPSRWRGKDKPVVVLGSQQSLKDKITVDFPNEKEQHKLFATKFDKYENPAIVSIGADVRGTIFAFYTFAERVLGIDPMYIFTDNIPQKRKEIRFTPEMSYTSQKPSFEYRGWFINDEELHDGMHRDPLGGNVISMEWMDKILETLLRCKGNMIIPESAPYPDATVYDLCRRREVAISHHHVTPVGLNMMNWPEDVNFSFVTHKEILKDAWRKAALAQKDNEVAWIVGFRGKSDGAFWHTDPAAPTDDKGRAKVISEAIKTQVEIIREQDPNATIAAALWNEQSKFYNEGLLEIPEGVCKMFSDDGRGYMRDDGGVNVGKGDGLYYHVMMMMNSQNRTTEAVPATRFYKELKRYVEKGATKYAVINVSGIRPAALSVEAITDFLWDARPALSKAPEEAMHDYMNAWYAKAFSPSLASKLTDLRMQYYNIPYLREKMPVQGRWKGARGEHLLQYSIDALLKHYGGIVAKGEDVTQAKDFNKVFKDSKEPLAETATFFPKLWKATTALEKEIPEARKDYYAFHFRYQVAVHMYSSQVLSIITKAFDDYIADRKPEAFAKALEKALPLMEKLLEEAHNAEYGIWDTMFMHVRLMDLYKSRLRIKNTIAQIRKEPYTDNYRGSRKGSFWGSAQEYMDYGTGTFPYFYEETGKGLNVLEKR